jgi:FkbM family methyltransferase
MQAIEAFTLPPDPVTQAERAFVMDTHGGRDQVARLARAGSIDAFEPPMPTLFLRAVRERPGLVIDVGANTGFYALIAAGASPENRVLAFEPDPSVLDDLRRNIALNGFEDRITVQAHALSDRIGKAPLFVPTQEHGLIETSSSLEAAFKEAHSAVHEVEVTTLDTLLGGWRDRLRRVTVIKVDVEGHEAPVLRGAERLIRRWRPLLFVEVLVRADVEALSAFIAAHDYRSIVLRPDGIGAPSRTVAFDPSGWNHAFVPAERAEAFAAA